MSCKRVSKKQSKVARTRATKIIKDVRKTLKNEYRFSDRLVGSATRNTIIKDPDTGFYDLDYQLVLTLNSKSSLKASDVKPRFLSAFNNVCVSYEKVEDSTTAITIIDTNHKYSLDFVILRDSPNPDKIIRRNNKPADITKNDYDWATLSKLNQAYDRFKNMHWMDKRDVCDDKIIPEKCREKQKDEPQRKSSVRIFKEEVNKYEEKY